MATGDAGHKYLFIETADDKLSTELARIIRDVNTLALDKLKATPNNLLVVLDNNSILKDT